jgi:non-specific protein-tyrosine kinase
VIEAATVPGAPISPHPRRNAELAAIVALMLGFALVSSIDRMDRRVRRPNEIEQLVGAPLLAVVPHEAFPGNAPSSSVREAFQTLRTSLTYFNIDEPLSRVLVTSAMKSDGKTTTATNLAVAAARGGKRVVIVDADLRKPAVASRMGIEQPRFGLSDVLVGEHSAEEAFVPVDVGGNGSLFVLPAGTIPPNPSELIGSQRMRAVLDEVGRHAELIIIDSPPVLPVSDAIPLLDQTSGVVIVARVNRTRRDALTRLSQVIAAAGGKVLGVVATGSSGAGLQEEGGYSYAAGYG